MQRITERWIAETADEEVVLGETTTVAEDGPDWGSLLLVGLLGIAAVAMIGAALAKSDR